MTGKAALTLEERVHNLVSQMTLEEKISQMVYQSPAIERLDVPQYNWWNECLHGLGRAGVATVFPQAIGLAATWNLELMSEVAIATSDEARAKHHEALRLGKRDIYVGLTYWTPNINIFRDPRWGRGQETYGEDPYLTAAMGVRFIKGLQGNDPNYLKLVATPKHFAVHSGPESSRHHFDARVDEDQMRAFYLFAFEAAIKEGKAASIMGAYNRTNGEPCCASHTLLQQILRTEWGFEGYVVSDCGAITDIFEHHKVVDTAAEAAAMAVKNGCELDCGIVYPALIDAVDQGLISPEEIDLAVERIFTARFQLGMFDAPEQVAYSSIPFDVVDSPKNQQLALQAAQESIVLLKNKDNLLPISKEIASVAVIGPNADDVSALLGNYNGTPRAPITPLEGIRAKLSPDAQLYYTRGCNLSANLATLEVIPSEYLHPEKESMEEHGLKASYYANTTFAGQPEITQVDESVDFIWKDTSPISGIWGDHFGVRWQGYLVPPSSGTYRLGVNGFSDYRLCLDDELIFESSFINHSILKEAEIHLEAGRSYQIEIELFNEGLDPQIQLLWSRPDLTLQEDALEAASKAELVVMVLGLSPLLEREEMPDAIGDDDRNDIDLPDTQERLLREIAALGKPMVLVLMSGSALAVNWADEHIPAIVQAWYPGQAGGAAIADVLFGDVNPSGKLPVTVYKDVEDLPPFEDYGLEGHTYRYFRGEPLYPFGYGLSYTQFEFGHLHIDKAEIEAGDQIVIRAEVKNTGERAGDEVVQLYTHQPGDSQPLAIKELKGFQRISLQPGETKTITFVLHTGQLGIYNQDMHYVVCPGKVEVMLGNSSQHIALHGEFEIVGEITEMGADKVFFSDVRIN